MVHRKFPNVHLNVSDTYGCLTGTKINRAANFTVSIQEESGHFKSATSKKITLSTSRSLTRKYL